MNVASPQLVTVCDAKPRPSFEIADIVRAHGKEFVRTHATSAEQRKVLRAIKACRTAALGGHVEQCDGCSDRRVSYNSCRNRHCPKCQGTEQARWMAAEAAMLLPVPYFHVVFTLPHALNALVRVNRRLLLGLLFRVAARTLRAFALDPSHLGAEPSITMVLHTWGQTLEEHYHLHCVISGGGLSLDGRCWVGLPAGKRKRPFLFPVRALSEVFRGKFIAALQRLRGAGHLKFHGMSEPLSKSGPWRALTSELYLKPWVVYAKPPFGGPERVLKYLSRYTHRIAISNRRILHVGNGQVRFTYRDYADQNRRKEMTLPAGEFLRRLLQHVAPRGFMRIRHYGITANCRRETKLTRARELLGQNEPVPTDPTPEPTPAVSVFLDDPNEPVAARCPKCGGAVRVVETFTPVFDPDTS